MKRITVLLAEDHQIVREGFRSLLEHERDIEVVGEAKTGRQAVQLTRKLHPAVVVMDIAMPLLNGLEATRQIRKDFPDTKVLFLSAHSDDAYVAQATLLGAAGFLLKRTSSHNLAVAIREVQKGKTFFSASVARRLKRRDLKSLACGGQPKQKSNHLSSREVEVLQLIAEGMPNKQVAAELGVSFKTVDKHRQVLMAKLDLHDVAGLTRYAISAGIIESHVQLTIL
ncbi:MAG TPA: response regulator transcription factor [Candidatus Acidoferrum sp.]|jgi:DNA-binding NarL/FixJ family response regulator|nr:response regulator transcription factor [Candidatus Acidoferrum sp.]